MMMSKTNKYKQQVRKYIEKDSERRRDIKIGLLTILSLLQQQQQLLLLLLIHPQKQNS